MVLSKDEQDFLKWQNQGKVDEHLLERYRSEREKGVPHVYLAGKVEFFGVELTVNSSCLIPRLETELLVERALGRFAGNSVLDLCTGSGAIGLAIKKHCPDCSVTLSDLSKEALETCKNNALQNGLEVEVVKGDFLASVAGRKFDMIVCNPPYISQKEYEALDPLVKDFEPRIALTDEGNGLVFYQKLARGAKDHLAEGSLLCLEIGKDQGEEVQALFDTNSWIVEVEKDYAGHDRFVFLRRI